LSATELIFLKRISPDKTTTDEIQQSINPMKTNKLAGITTVIFAAGFTFVHAQITGDLGSTSVGYGSPLAVQTINTGFGNSSGGGDATGSELDAGYGTISGGYLYLFLAGCYQNNGNHLNIFLADGRTGQSSLSTGVSPINAMNGSTFSSGFSATYALDFNDYSGVLYANTADLVNNNGGYQGSVSLTSGIGSGTLSDGIGVALNNTHASTMGTANTALSGATSGANTLTGIELAIPLSLLGNPSGSIEVLADINGNGNTYLSNQLLPGLPDGTGNLGNSGVLNLGSTPNAYFTVSVPEPSTLALAGLSGVLTLLALRRRK
jgi:hypothetical protein